MEEEKRETKGDLTNKLRNNPWILSTFILGILIIILLFDSLGVFSLTGNAISADEAGNTLLNVYQSGGVTGLSIDSVEEVSGMYLVNLLYQGELVPIYITKDGKYAGSLNSLSSDTTEGTGSVVGDTINMNDFSDNSLYPSIGPENAEKVVIEFSDFQCPFCVMASGLPSWVSTYATKYSDIINVAGKIEAMARQQKIKFIYVPMSFLGQESVYAAQASLCANEQGKFWEMSDEIFLAHDGEENNGKYSKAKLEIIAKKVTGLNQDKFKTCLENDETLSEVQEIASTAKSAGVTGTPMFFVNGEKVDSSWTALQAAIA